MFGIVRKTNREIRDRTVYMEVYGDNKVAYRVTTGWIYLHGENICTYGVEAEDYISGEKESIPDFSRMSTVLTLCLLCSNPKGHILFKALSPACPKGVCPRSCPKAMASARSSFKRNALAMVLAIRLTSMVWVMRVR